MLIGFSGVQSVGKTTLMNKLVTNQNLVNRFVFIDEIVRNIKKEGYTINENGNDDTQIRITFEHVKNIIDMKEKIVDRCLLDSYCYTLYLHKHNKISQKTFKFIKKISYDFMSEYDIIFYIEPEFDLIKDGIRSENNEFRNEMSSIFKKIVNTVKRKVKVVRLSGSVEQRMDTIYKTFKENSIEC